MHPPHDPLDDLLERWRDAPPPLAGPVGPEVWRRLAVADDLRAKAGWAARLEAVFDRPSFAFMFVAACVLLGLFLAEARVARLQAERHTQMAKHYLQLIDPLLADTQSRGPSAAFRP